MIRLKLSNKSANEGVVLDLPATPAEVSEAFSWFERISVDPSAVRIAGVNAPVPNLGSYILRANIQDPAEMKKLNELAEAIEQMDDREWDTVESHPAVLDGFVNLFRKAQAELQMFDCSHCDTMTGQELTGKVLVMSPYTLKESYWSPENQLWLATGGFGCSPSAAGRAVYATCLGDGEQTRWDRSDFIGILKEEHLPDWARESLEQLRQDAPAEAPDLNTQSM